MSAGSIVARVVLITAPSFQVAQQLSRGWLQKRLVACCNLIPVQSSMFVQPFHDLILSYMDNMNVYYIVYYI